MTYEERFEIFKATGLCDYDAKKYAKKNEGVICELADMKKYPEMYFQDLFCALPLDEDECAELKEAFDKILAGENLLDFRHANVNGVDYVVQFVY